MASRVTASTTPAVVPSPTVVVPEAVKNVTSAPVVAKKGRNKPPKTSVSMVIILGLCFVVIYMIMRIRKQDAKINRMRVEHERSSLSEDDVVDIVNAAIRVDRSRRGVVVEFPSSTSCALPRDVQKTPAAVVEILEGDAESDQGVEETEEREPETTVEEEEEEEHVTEPKVEGGEEHATETKVQEEGGNATDTNASLGRKRKRRG